MLPSPDPKVRFSCRRRTSSFGSPPFATPFSGYRPFGAFCRVRIKPGVSVFRVSPIAFPLSDPKARFPCFHSSSFLKAPRCLRRLSPPSLPRKEGGFHPASRVGLRVSSATFRRPLSEESISLRGYVNAFRVASTPFSVFSPEGGGRISLPRNLNAFPLTPLSYNNGPLGDKLPATPFAWDFHVASTSFDVFSPEGGGLPANCAIALLYLAQRRGGSRFPWRAIGLSSLAFPRLRFRSRTRRRGFRFPRQAHGAFRRLPLDVSIERPEGVAAANSLSTAVPIRTMRCFVVLVFAVRVFLPDAPKGNRFAVGQRHRRFL